jgi:glycosyltransferase involved in cell wall biosynthesis
MSKITVCLPTYNRAPLLKKCLASILNQTVGDYEVIVADNCSTDATAEVVRAFAHPRLRYHRHERNIGPFANMNWLIEHASGDYLCIAHDDDVYGPDFLQRESAMLDRYPNVGMVHCAVHVVDIDGTPRQVVRAYPTTRVLPGRDEFVRYLQGHNVCCSSVMARRALFRDNPFDSRFLSADFLMWIKFALRADVAYIAEPLLDMRVHPDAVTSWLAPSRWHEEFIGILEEGLALGATAYPSLIAERPALVRQAAKAQGRRFLIAALAAIARGDFQLARGYIAVLERLREIGLSRSYAVLARLTANHIGQRVLSAVALVRRARARRQAESLAKTMVTAREEA